MEVTTIHKVQDEAQFVRGMESVCHTYNERAVHLYKQTILIPGKNLIFGQNCFITLIFIMRLLQLLHFHYPLSFPGVCANFTFEIKLVNFNLYKNFSLVSTVPPGYPTDITDNGKHCQITENTGLLENKSQFVIETLFYVAYILHR